MIIGFTTGRSGSVSLSEWLNTWHEFKQEGKYYLSELEDHDKTAWFVEMFEASNKYDREPGDISLDHINNLDYWLDQKSTLIVLMRDHDDTVESIYNHPRKHIWERLFPQFDFNKKEDISKYWDWYYDTLLEHEDKLIVISPEQMEVRKNEKSS